MIEKLVVRAGVQDEQNRPAIPRGWVILTLAAASWALLVLIFMGGRSLLGG